MRLILNAATQREPLPLSSLSQRALRWYFVISLIVLHACAGKPPLANLRLTPPDDSQTVVVGSGVAPWVEICIERQFGEADSFTHYDCVTVGELRAIVKQRLQANN